MMKYDNLEQCWARFIELLGNPADLMTSEPRHPIRIDRLDYTGQVIDKREYE